MKEDGSGSYKSIKWKTITNALRSISASTVRTIGGGSYGSQSSGAEEEQQREQVLWAGFEMLELGPSDIRHVLLLAYQNGFQVWDVESAKDVRELISRRDGPVSYLRLQPSPCTQESHEGSFRAARPLLLVISGEISCDVGSVPGGYNSAQMGSDGAISGNSPNTLPTIIRFYSLQTHQYVHTLKFGAGIYGVHCSSRVVAVGFVAQIYCYDADTLQNILSVLTYPNPQTGPGGGSYGLGAMALGPRWLAYAANQPLVSCTGRASPQHLSPSPGVSPSTSPANGNLVAYYAKESSKQLAAGIITLSDMGYKTLSRYYSEFHLDGPSSPGSGSPRMKSSNGPVLDPENAGIVIVRDFVSKAVVAQFKAHKSPLSALSFNQNGTLLVTASVNGRNFNVFLLMPQSTSNVNMSMAHDISMSYVHLYKLTRGITSAVIQDIVFSSDSRWICVSSSRGTSHLYAISPFGGSVGYHTHGVMAVSGIVQSKVTPLPVIPWWSTSGPVKAGHQSFLPPPTLVLSVVNRIKNGPARWIGTVSDVAAAATGRTISSGAVAAVFHDGGDYDSESHYSPDALTDKLWVLCSSGHLVRYLLHPSIGHVGFADGNAVDAGTPGFDFYQAHDFSLYVEPLEKWDVCRRSNWSEQETRIYTLASNVAESEEARSEQVGDLKAEDSHHLYISKAEIQMQQARPFPIWAKPNISFEVLLLDAKKDLGNGIGPGGELEIEKVPTRVIEVRRKDLTPLVEKFRSHESRSNGSNLQIDLVHGEVVGRNTAASIPIRRIGFGREVYSVPGKDLFEDASQSVRSTTGSRMVQRQPSISEMDGFDPSSRASGPTFNHEHQGSTSASEWQKHKQRNGMSKDSLRFNTLLGTENNPTRFTDIGNLVFDHSNTLDHLARGLDGALVVKEPKDGYFDIRDNSKEDVKTVNLDTKLPDADYRSSLALTQLDDESLRDNSQTAMCEMEVRYGSDGHHPGQLNHQIAWTIKDCKKDLAVDQFPAVNVLHIEGESAQDVGKKAHEGLSTPACMDSLEDPDGSDSISQQDEHTGESGGEMDGAMFLFNEEGT